MNLTYRCSIWDWERLWIEGTADIDGSQRGLLFGGTRGKKPLKVVLVRTWVRPFVLRCAIWGILDWT